MITIDKVQIPKIWESFQNKHLDMQYRLDHYKGKQKFLNKKHNSDGSEKSAVAINLLDYIVDAHVSGATSNPFQYVPQKQDADLSPFEQLQEVIDENDLETLDAEHFRNSLIMGYSVEVHSFKNNKICIKQYSPLEWVFIYDTDKEVQLAIHKCILQPNTIFNGTFISKDTTMYTVYDAAFIRKFRKADNSEELVLIEEQEHFYNSVPVVTFYTNKDKAPFLNDNIIQQNNLFCKLFNSRVDDIDYNVDSLLKITGYGGVDVTEPSQLEKLKIMKEQKIFIIPDQHSDIAFITKGNESAKYNDALIQSREALFTQAKVPDRQDVKGAIGALSGVAIKHMYQPTIQQSEFFMKYFQKGLRQRVKLINRIWELLGYPVIESFKINHNFHLPVDLESITSSVKNLDGMVSKLKQLEMLPGVDPQQELQRLAEEQASTPTPVPATNSTPVVPFETDPEKRTKRKIAAIEKSVTNASTRIEKEVLGKMKTDVADSIVQSDALKKFLGK